jgi:hypothetical protein
VAGGGLSQPGQLKLTFKEGGKYAHLMAVVFPFPILKYIRGVVGGFEFYSIFRELLERIDGKR